MSFQDAYWAAPPVSRTITAASVLLSWPGHLGLYDLSWVIYYTPYVFTYSMIPQIWRVVTCFFITGAKLGMIMDPFFLYHYSSQLETGSPRFSGAGSYAFYLIFVSLVILLTGGVYLQGPTLLSALSMALIYTFAQEDPNRQVQFFIVQMPAKFLPYASLAITFILAGPIMTMIQATGILAAHLYDFLDRVWPQFGGGQRYIQVPQILQKLFVAQGGQARAYGTAFGSRPGGPGQQPAAANQGGSGWSSGSAWNSRGNGRRLGGE